MLDRLLGLETEYAIRYTGPGPRPSHRRVYEALVSALESRLATLDGVRKTSRHQRFLQNGGALYYEYLAKAPDGGLIEASTPECRGPSQLLLYQRAQDRLLYEALPWARAALHAEGFVGELGLLKNCRDVQGHVYGAQENYEVELARGLALWVYRVGLALLVPLVLSTGFVCLVLGLSVVLLYGLPVLALLFFAAGLTLLRPRWATRVDALVSRALRGFEVLERVGTGIGMVGTLVPMAGYSVLFRLCCCRRIRADALGFLLSRPLITGAGTLDPDTGAFGLSEKGPAIRALVRTTALPGDRSLFDIGNLLKQLYSVLDLRLWPLWRLFRRRQRLQLGMSDSNCAQQAEYLKLATTSLVLDMAEAGALRSLPRVRGAIAALHRMCGDPESTRALMCSDAVVRTNLELQRLYLEAARRFVAESDAPAIEASEIVKIWAQTLDALERDPDQLFGQLDWVTKRGLLARASEPSEAAARKKIDLKYHELGSGYLAQLEAEGLAPRLVGDEEIDAAIVTAPADTPARRRSQLVCELAGQGVEARVGWSRVEIKRGVVRREVIRLDDYRERGPEKKP